MLGRQRRRSARGQAANIAQPSPLHPRVPRALLRIMKLPLATRGMVCLSRIVRHFVYSCLPWKDFCTRVEEGPACFGNARRRLGARSPVCLKSLDWESQSSSGTRRRVLPLNRSRRTLDPEGGTHRSLHTTYRSTVRTFEDCLTKGDSFCSLFSIFL